MTKFVFAIRCLVGFWRPNNLHKNPRAVVFHGRLFKVLFLEFKAALFRVYNYVRVLYAGSRPQTCMFI